MKKFLAAVPAVVTTLAVALVLAGCGGSSNSASSDTESTTTTTTSSTTATMTTTETTTESMKPTTMAIVVSGGVPKGGITRKTVKKGDRVAVVVKSDVSDEVHVHGYDLKGDVAPGKPVRIAFVAKIPGRFEIELESRGLQIGDLTVQS